MPEVIGYEAEFTEQVEEVQPEPEPQAQNESEQ